MNTYFNIYISMTSLEADKTLMEIRELSPDFRPNILDIFGRFAASPTQTTVGRMPRQYDPTPYRYCLGEINQAHADKLMAKWRFPSV